jgi:undecaprenyl-phosphate 4-deoxy-4-formamido-L-arabinose transferase
MLQAAPFRKLLVGSGTVPDTGIAPATLPNESGDGGNGGVPAVSVVVPVYNEEATLEEIYRQAVEALEAFGRPYELLFVDDGSTDGTWPIIERLHAGDGHVRALRFKRNFGQHPAMHAGLVRARGDIVVTMDADLQNSPSDLPKLIAAVEAGSDVASGRRRERDDSRRRTLPSRIVNGMLRRFTGVAISDFGCAFNAYRREAVVPVLGSIGKQHGTKALVLSSGASVVEVDVEHRARRDESRYSPFRLVRLALNVIVGFWPRPIQWAGAIIGFVASALSLGVAAWGLVHWIARADFPGPVLLGALVLGVLGIQGFILALVGESLGRIQRDVEGRPIYTIERELG